MTGCGSDGRGRTVLEHGGGDEAIVAFADGDAFLAQLTVDVRRPGKHLLRHRQHDQQTQVASNAPVIGEKDRNPLFRSRAVLSPTGCLIAQARTAALGAQPHPLTRYRFETPRMYRQGTADSGVWFRKDE
jgi:hypothetical protein